MSSRTAAGRVRAKFFCDNCGAEVSLAAPSCPQCSRPFSSVRCPRCGFAGQPRAFSSGCPSCGYAAAGGGGENPKERGPSRPGTALPRGFYTAMAVGLAVLLLASVLVLALRLSR